MLHALWPSRDWYPQHQCANENTLMYFKDRYQLTAEGDLTCSLILNCKCLFCDINCGGTWVTCHPIKQLKREHSNDNIKFWFGEPMSLLTWLSGVWVRCSLCKHRELQGKRQPTRVGILEFSVACRQLMNLRVSSPWILLLLIFPLWQRGPCESDESMRLSEAFELFSPWAFIQIITFIFWGYNIITSFSPPNPLT